MLPTPTSLRLIHQHTLDRRARRPRAMTQQPVGVRSCRRAAPAPGRRAADAPPRRRAATPPCRSGVGRAERSAHSPKTKSTWSCAPAGSACRDHARRLPDIPDASITPRGKTQQQVLWHAVDRLEPGALDVRGQVGGHRHAQARIAPPASSGCGPDVRPDSHGRSRLRAVRASGRNPWAAAGAHGGNRVRQGGDLPHGMNRTVAEHSKLSRHPGGCQAFLAPRLWRNPSKVPGIPPMKPSSPASPAPCPGLRARRRRSRRQPAARPARSILPAQELTPRTLYHFLLAEIAGARVGSACRHSSISTSRAARATRASPPRHRDRDVLAQPRDGARRRESGPKSPRLRTGAPGTSPG